MFLTVVLAAATVPDPPPVVPDPPPLKAAIPEGATRYESARFTQEIAVTDNRDRISPFRIRLMRDRRWRQPGGLLDITGWRSAKYRTLPDGEGVTYWVGDIGVLNSFGYIQRNRGILRRYPDGTRFDEILSTDAGVFEHRVREKHGGKWYSDIIYKNPEARPEGYAPVSVTKCAGCHNEAGTGKYAEGLVPGGDGVLSDPLYWELLYAKSPEE